MERPCIVYVNDKLVLNTVSVKSDEYWNIPESAFIVGVVTFANIGAADLAAPDFLTPFEQYVILQQFTDFSFLRAEHFRKPGERILIPRF